MINLIEIIGLSLKYHLGGEQIKAAHTKQRNRKDCKNTDKWSST